MFPSSVFPPRLFPPSLFPRSGGSTVTPITGAFKRVSVDYMIVGTARVTWDLERHFKDPAPASWTYTLQANVHGPLPSFSAGGSARTDDWVDITPSATNVASLNDTARRARGKTLLVSYRIRLTTPRGTYLSPPGVTLGHLNKHDWLLAQEITRKELLLHRLKTSTSGFLLRRKRDGTPCTNCLDPATGEATLSKCPVCAGTRFIAGYWAAVPATFCRMEPNETREKLDLQATGPSKQDTTTGRILAVPGMQSGDVWVDGDSDMRYHVHTVKLEAQVRNVPVILRVELRQAAFDDVVYTVSLAGG